MNAPRPRQPADPFGSAYRVLRDTLRLRHLGQAVAHAPDWIEPTAIDAVMLPLGPHDGEPVLRLSVCDGVPMHAMPRQWEHQGVEVRIKPVRSPRLQVQNSPGVSRELPPRVEGTATCLARDRLNPDRYYLVTCGHVVAPNIHARYDEPIQVSIGNETLSAHLREWQPAVGNNLPTSMIDAALLELDMGATLMLRNAIDDTWLPARIGDVVRRDLPVQLCRYDGAIRGSMKVYWSGKVCFPDGDTLPDYFLDDAIGYMSAEPTRPGDSGAPVWSADDALIGMHIGAIDAAGAYGANAVFGRITPVLDWFQIKPFTRDDPASLDVEDRPGRAPKLNLPPSGQLLHPKAGEQTIFAQTLWGEARGEGVAGMEAVACVIMNRLRTHFRGCESVAAVCLDPKQFSCWQRGDPNRRELEQVVRAPDAAYLQAEQIVSRALGGALMDVTRNARHYYSTTMPSPPSWAHNRTPCYVIGRHLFFNTVP